MVETSVAVATPFTTAVLIRTGSTGGLILIDRRGKIGYARNTTHMPVCSITEKSIMAIDS